MEALVQRAALMFVVIIALGACSSDRGSGVGDKRHASMADLQREVEYSLIPPGAFVTSLAGQNGFQNITGFEHAYAGHRFRTVSPFADVARYYHDELTKLGWLPDFSPLLRRSDEEGRGWCRPGRRFDLRIGVALLEGQFAYEAVLIDNERPCPDRFEVPPASPAPTAPPHSTGQGPP